MSEAALDSMTEIHAFDLLKVHLLGLHSAPIPGSNPGGGSDPSCGVSLTHVYTVIPLTEQTPQAGQNERAQVRNFLLLHMEKFHTLRGLTQLSVYTCTQK